MTADLVALAYALIIYAMAESNQDEGSASSLVLEQWRVRMMKRGSHDVTTMRNSDIRYYARPELRQ